MAAGDAKIRFLLYQKYFFLLFTSDLKAKKVTSVDSENPVAQYLEINVLLIKVTLRFVGNTEVRHQ